MAEGVVTDPGALPSETRRTILQRARGGASEEPVSLDEALLAFVDKVTAHAYKVTDRDIENLKRAGYSEDAIFEVTACTAVGAGMARLDATLRALGRID